MVSFRRKLVQGFTELGIGVSFDIANTPYDAILVIGGTRDLAGLWRAKRRGVRIVQRLNGMNWIHRKRKTGWKHYLRAEYGNIILSSIRSHLADQIIYQSKFSHQWWERVYGADRTPWHVIYNGVDLARYTPMGDERIVTDHKRILLVEGSIAGGYEWGLETAIQMAERINFVYNYPIELLIVGRVAASLQREYSEKSRIKVNFAGEVPVEKIPELDRSAHVLYAADVNAACPNSVIEALACGLPVVAFDTGALSELITVDAGRLSPYGGDPWNLDPPDIESLAEAANQIITNQVGFRTAARKRAEEAFPLNHMVHGYLDVINL